MPPLAPERPTQWNVAAAIAAWLLPGMGHWLLGEKRRASILGSTIGVLWLTGSLLGGVSVFDMKNRFWWFLAQSCLAPSIVADQVHQVLRKQSASEEKAGRPPLYEPGYGRIDEQGVLYTSLAGLLNLLAVLDVAVRDPSRRRSDSEAAPATAAPATAAGGGP